MRALDLNGFLKIIFCKRTAQLNETRMTFEYKFENIT